MAPSGALEPPPPFIAWVADHARASGADELVLALHDELHGFPWESWFRSPVPGGEPHVRRVASDSSPRPGYTPSARGEMMTLGDSRLHRGIDSLWRKRVPYTTTIDRGTPLQRRLPSPDVTVLHALGRVVDREQLRLQLGDDSNPDALPAEAVSTRRMNLVFPRLELCILQGEARFTSSTEHDRQEAFLLRAFGAELAALGVPAVIIIPALDPSDALQIAERLAFETTSSAPDTPSLVRGVGELRRTPAKDLEAVAAIALYCVDSWSAPALFTL